MSRTRDNWLATYGQALAAAGYTPRYFNADRARCLALLCIALDRLHRLTGSDVDTLARSLDNAVIAIVRTAGGDDRPMVSTTGWRFSTRAAAGQRRKAGAGSVGSAAGTGLAPADVRPKSQQSRPARGKAAQ